MKRRKIGIDCDEVIRKFYESLIRVYLREYPDHKLLPISEWTSYGIEKYFPIGDKIHTFFKEQKPYHVMMDAKPFDGAVEFVDEVASKDDVIIVTKQPNRLLEEITKDWLDYNDFRYHGVEFLQDKSDFEGAYLLDDHTDNLEMVKKKGITIPVALNTNMNKNWNGLRVYSYQEFLDLIK